MRYEGTASVSQNSRRTLMSRQGASVSPPLVKSTRSMVFCRPKCSKLVIEGEFCTDGDLRECCCPIDNRGVLPFLFEPFEDSVDGGLVVGRHRWDFDWARNLGSLMGSSLSHLVYVQACHSKGSVGSISLWGAVTIGQTWWRMGQFGAIRSRLETIKNREKQGINRELGPLLRLIGAFLTW